MKVNDVRAATDGLAEACGTVPGGTPCKKTPRAFIDEARTQEAKTLCAACPLQGMCREFGISTGQPEGVWGGWDHDDRVSYARRMAATRRASRRRMKQHTLDDALFGVAA